MPGGRLRYPPPHRMNIAVVIPAFDEQPAIGTVVRRCHAAARGLGTPRVVVADNGSTDGTGEAAAAAGAEVVVVRPRGYGRACLGAAAHLGQWPSVLVFVDGDGSCRPEEMSRLLQPIRAGEADLVIGCRSSNAALTFPQRWGTWLATRLIGWRWGRHFSDIGPFRAIRLDAYNRLGMRDVTWGWTVEMQILALLKGLRIRQVEVSWDPRLAGFSKISGTVSGVWRAGVKILWTIARYAFRRRAASGQ
ncbi:MAG: glycosyltransferase family 2 protein [Acidobacteriota bacterium]